MESDNSTLIFVALAIFFVNIWVMFIIIQNATKSRSILKLQRMQVELLKEIAIKNEVPIERVNEIIETHNDEKALF